MNIVRKQIKKIFKKGPINTVRKWPKKMNEEKKLMSIVRN